MIVFTKDDLRASVEAATGGKVTVIYDDKGYPSYMVVVPKFKLEDVEPSGKLGTGVHPAFIVNDSEKSEIFIGQYQAIVKDGRAVSLPGFDPKVYVTYDQAKGYCKSKGPGWHLMTIHEWAAVALWCLKNGFQPRGNSNWGQAHDATYETGRRVDGGQPGNNSGTGRTLTGSGPASWRHDNTFAGIADLVANIWEWNHLMKLVNGRFYLPDTNDFDLDEANWPVIDAYIDSPSAGDNSGSSNLGEPILSDSITNFAGNQDDNGYYDYNYDSSFVTLNIKSGWNPPLILKQLLLCPKEYDSTAGAHVTIPVYEGLKGAFWARNYGERIPIKGGNWDNGGNVGLGALSLSDHRSHSHWSFGFRPAFVS